MLLQPRTFKYKKRQKSRTVASYNTSNHLNFGNSGLLLLRPIVLTSHHLFKIRLFLKRATRRSDRTRRFTWFHAFPYLPLTKKPDGLRMGKGKGKLECWHTTIAGGTILFEFRNLRFGRSVFFFTQTTHKLGIATKFIFPSSTYFNLPLKTTKKVHFRAFW